MEPVANLGVRRPPANGCPCMKHIDFSEARKMKRFPFLDAARGLACIGVVACHCDLSHLFLWYWGVMDFFFVMSGLLITRSLVSNCDKGRGVFPFLLYRALRLLPAYVTVMVLYELTFFVLGTREPFQTLPYLFFYQYTDLIFGTVEKFHRIPEMEPYWSLILEEQYYLLWGFFFCLFAYAKLRINKASLGVVILLLGCSMLIRKAGMHEWTLPARFDGFLLGSMAGIIIFMPHKVNLPGVWTGRMTGFLGLAGLAAFARLLWSGLLSYHDPALYFKGVWLDVTCFSVFSLCLVLGMVKIDIRRIHLGKLQDGLAFLGLVSYEIYLVHLPIVELLKWFFNFNYSYGKALLFLLTMGLSTIVAHTMHRLLTAAALKKREEILAFIAGRFRRKTGVPAHAPATILLTEANLVRVESDDRERDRNG
jgi:peptidoglycan/LPS O-acetylase OafA/YrhL